MERCAVSQDLRAEMARQDALEARQGYIDTQVDELMKDENVILEALTEMYGDNPEDLFYVCAPWLAGNKIKRKVPDIHWRVEDVSPLTVLTERVREHLETTVMEGM